MASTSQQVVAVVAREPATRPQKSGFKCFCGEWFPNRGLFDEHLRKHPGRFTMCEDCKRVLPKGSWKVDGDGNFVSVDEPNEGARLGRTR